MDAHGRDVVQKMAREGVTKVSEFRVIARCDYQQCHWKAIRDATVRYEAAVHLPENNCLRQGIECRPYMPTAFCNLLLRLANSSGSPS